MGCDPVLMPEPQIVVMNTPDHPRNGEGDIIALRGGDLLLGYGRWNANGDDFGAAEIWSKISHDGGKTWGDDRLLVANEGKVTTFEVGFVRLPDKAILLSYCVKESTEDCSICFRRSTDEGLTWGERVKYTIPAPYTGYTGINNGRLIRLRSGRLLLAAYDGWVRGTVIVSFVLYSDDNGRTWTKSTDVDARDVRPDDKYGADEPAVVELKDGRVMMIARTDFGVILKAYSTDHGTTWGKPEPIQGVVSPNSPASIARIPKTGDLLLIWNNNTSARNPLNSAVSRDEGLTWQHVRVVDFGPASLCYTSITPVGNRVLLTYYGRGGLALRSLPYGWFYEKETLATPWTWDGPVDEMRAGARWRLTRGACLYIQDMPASWDGSRDAEVEATVVLRSLLAGKRATSMLWIGDHSPNSSCALYLAAGEKTDAVSFSETMDPKYEVGDVGQPHRYRIVTHHQTGAVDLFVDGSTQPVLSTQLGPVLGQYNLNRILYGDPKVDFLGGDSDLVGISWKDGG